VTSVRLASAIAALLVVAAVAMLHLQRADQQNSSQAPIHRNTPRSQQAVISVETTPHVGIEKKDTSAEAAPAQRSMDPPRSSSAARVEDSAAMNVDHSLRRQDDSAHRAISVSQADRPFPLSKSVRRDCEGVSADVGICVDVARLLKRFAEEPRDVTWATKTEARIRAFVDNEGGKYAIRALECRRSVCAVEVESIHGPYLGVDYQTQIDNAVEDSVAAFGDERDSLGQDVTITLRLIERN
jgi:hypothetical protein